MPARLDPETAPNTVVVVEDSFKQMLQRASGHGEALQIEVDHTALMEAAVDSGFTSGDVLSFAFTAMANHRPPGI